MKSRNRIKCPECGQEFTPAKYRKHLFGKCGTLLNVVQACCLFKTSRWTLRLRVKESGITGKIKGRQTIYFRSDLFKLFDHIQPPKPSNNHSIMLTVSCKGFTENEIFKIKHIKKQVKWLKDRKRRFKKNQDEIASGKASDWGRLNYYKKDIL